MNVPRILIQLDSDPHASVFDAIVAQDSEVERLLQYGGVTIDSVEGLVHGAMFTRSPQDLKSTALFVGGSNVEACEALCAKIKKTFFGPMRVSLMLDGNGSNTTAAAAVLCAARHLELSQCRALVLGGTGPVGRRVARLILRQGGQVSLASRSLERSKAACDSITSSTELPSANLVPIANQGADCERAVGEATVVFGCGAAGVTLLDETQLQQATALKVAIDLNAVPPAGLAGIGVTDKAVEREGRHDYGAIGVGGLKMKIHRAAIRSLFTANDLVLDAEEIFDIGLGIEQARI